MLYLHDYILFLQQPTDMGIFISIFPMKKLNFRSEVTCSQIYKHSLKHTTTGDQNTIRLYTLLSLKSSECVSVTGNVAEGDEGV